LAENPGVEFWPVDYTNDPRVIAREDRIVAINAAVEVDFPGPMRVGVAR
jgi:acyl-CoA hydrolase